ncbi:MAG: sugar-transfer associated ATP-grasp domain-containing protein [Bacilli bacterium]
MKMINDLKVVSKRENIKVISLITDFLVCKTKYNFTFEEYFKMQLYKLNDKKRNEVLNNNINIKLINKLNPFEHRYLMASIYEFNHKFESFIKRDWLLLDEQNNEEFRLFIKSRDFIFVPSLDNRKPEIIDIKRNNEWQLHQDLINSYRYIIEEVVTNHKKIKAINASSLNTIKFITILNNNDVYILGSYLNVYINDKKYYILIDLATGKTYNKALLDGLVVDHIENYIVKSFKIPLWEKTLAMVNKLPFVIDKLKYISWEIAITDKEPILIKASEEPDYMILNHPIYLENNNGLFYEINLILGGNL